MNRHAPASEILKRISQHWPELAHRIHPPLIYLYRARDLLIDNIEGLLLPLDMRTSDLDVLGTLRTQPRPWQLSPTELYRALLLSSGGLTKILHRLEAAGWVDRPCNPEDGRGKLVRLTPAGEQQLEKAIGLVLEYEDRRMTVLSDSEQRQLEQLLGKLVGTWEA